MKTQIYKSYAEFDKRKDRDENGVSEQFAANNKSFAANNETNKGCWDCCDCFGCSDCSGCSGCYGCSGCSGCSDCSGCSGCSDCSDCSGCSGCSGCYGCYHCYDKKDSKPTASKSWFDIPIIPNLHRTVLAAVSQPPNALDMSDWHTCETTHCRAGWVVTLAGEKGKALESSSSTLFAAMQICNASSKIKVSPARFFESNEVAMADIKRCAELEARP